MKKIYLVTRSDDDYEYDEYDSVVVVAKTPKEAKEYVIREGYEGFKDGLIICELIGDANKSQPYGEVLASFNAG